MIMMMILVMMMNFRRMQIKSSFEVGSARRFICHNSLLYSVYIVYECLIEDSKMILGSR
jgi:hypothetical protein